MLETTGEIIDQEETAGESAGVRRIPDAQKQEWLDVFKGASLEVPIKFGNPMVRNLFRRTFYITARNMYSILMYMPAHVSAAKADEAEQHIVTLITALQKDLQQSINAAKGLIAENGIDARASYRAPEEGMAVITSPLSHQHLHLFRLMDDLALHLDTLWLNNVRSSKERNAELYKVKVALRNFALRMRSMYVEMQRQIQSKEAKKAVPKEDRVSKREEREEAAAPASDEPAAATA